MSITSIKLDGGISDPEFVEISTNARKRERAHLLGLLRIYVGQLKKGKGHPGRSLFINRTVGRCPRVNHH